MNKPSHSFPMPSHYPLAILVLVIVLSTSAANAAKKPRKISSLARNFVACHNAARLAVRMQPLVWDKKLAKYAQWYANKRSKDCALKHSNGPYGENIFWGSGHGWTAAEAVAAWVGEKRWYSYRLNACRRGEECGHYTQVVWRKTRNVGCAKVDCFGGKGVFIVCNYDPPGNYIGERPF